MTSVHHVNVVVPVGEVDANARFYEDVFGFARIPKPPAAGQGGAWFEVDAATQLHLSERTGGPHPDAHVAYAVDDFGAVRSRLEVAGAPWEDAADVFGGGRGFTRDPAGNRIEVLERT